MIRIQNKELHVRMKNASDLIEKQLKDPDGHFTQQKPRRPMREAEMFHLLAKQGSEPEGP